MQLLGGRHHFLCVVTRETEYWLLQDEEQMQQRDQEHPLSPGLAHDRIACFVVWAHRSPRLSEYRSGSSEGKAG